MKTVERLANGDTIVKESVRRFIAKRCFIAACCASLVVPLSQSPAPIVGWIAMAFVLACYVVGMRFSLSVSRSSEGRLLFRTVYPACRQAFF